MNPDFKTQYMQKFYKEHNHIRYFKERTEKRIQELNEKKANKTITRAEIFELDMCKGDLVRAKKALGIK